MKTNSSKIIHVGGLLIGSFSLYLLCLFIADPILSILFISLLIIVPLIYPDMQLWKRMILWAVFATILFFSVIAGMSDTTPITYIALEVFTFALIPIGHVILKVLRKYGTKALNDEYNALMSK